MQMFSTLSIHVSIPLNTHAYTLSIICFFYNVSYSYWMNWGGRPFIQNRKYNWFSSFLLGIYLEAIFNIFSLSVKIRIILRGCTYCSLVFSERNLRGRECRHYSLTENRVALAGISCFMTSFGAFPEWLFGYIIYTYGYIYTKSILRCKCNIISLSSVRLHQLFQFFFLLIIFVIKA
jgi:hypothetical protein